MTSLVVARRVAYGKNDAPIFLNQYGGIYGGKKGSTEDGKNDDITAS